MKFGPKTIMRFECRQCDEVEMIKLGDLPTTPGGKFILPSTGQCIRCLNVIDMTVREEDQN